MEKYKVVTEKFEGPLDLLLHLINKDKLDIYDIPIAGVTEQYLAYIGQMQEFDIELASEFLVMAAILLQIKSRLLLPKQLVEETMQEDEEQQDPRRELADRLITYKKFKLIAETLSEMWQKNTLYFTRQPLELEKTTVLPKGMTIAQLLAALANILATDEKNITYIAAEDFNVKDKIDDILELLQFRKGILTLHETLVRSGGQGELVTAFLAILELMRIGKIVIDQPEKFGDIYLYLKEA